MFSFVLEVGDVFGGDVGQQPISKVETKERNGSKLKSWEQ